jgi:hypothetical protein
MQAEIQCGESKGKNKKIDGRKRRLSFFPVTKPRRNQKQSKRLYTAPLRIEGIQRETRGLRIAGKEVLYRRGSNFRTRGVEVAGWIMTRKKY